MLNEMEIKKLEDAGFKRWTKNTMDRLYINPETLGLECEYYKTGNISYAEFQGKKISNCRARDMKASKTYIDIKTGKLYSNNYTLEEAARELMEKTLEADESECA